MSGRWKVKKSTAGAWWAHEPTCASIPFLCVFLSRCVKCGPFHKAYAYAETMAIVDRKYPWVPTRYVK